MRDKLQKKLHEHIKDNHPDLLLHLLEENRLDLYLNEQISSVDRMINDLLSEHKSSALIEELCLEELIKPLRPSRYNYLHDLLREEFPEDFEQLYHRDVLTTEIINMIDACDAVFDEMNFSEENKDDMYVRYAIMGAVHEYLERV